MSVLLVEVPSQSASQRLCWRWEVTSSRQTAGSLQPPLRLCNFNPFSEFSWGRGSVLSLVMCMLVSVCSVTLFSIGKLTGISRPLSSTKSFMLWPLPLSKTNTSYKALGDAVLWLRMSRWVGAAKSSDTSQPVNLYRANHRLTRTRYVPVALASTWLEPLSVCDHSQRIYFPPNHRRWSIVFPFYSNNKKKGC